MSWFRVLSLGRRSEQVRAKYPRRNPPRQRPCLEPLERRDLLTGSISLVDGLVTIRCDWGAADTARVTYDDRGTPLQINDDRVIVTLSHDGELHAEAFNLRRQVFNVQTRTFDWVTNVTSIRFHGYDGNDTFRNDSSLPSEAWGGDGKDHLVGGSGNDILHGETGDDNLEGRDGRDSLWGDGGNDTAYGGAGDDGLHGGSGNDWLLGGTGNDDLNGGNDKDVLAGEAGDDRLEGGRDGWGRSDGFEDELWGGTGADSFVRDFNWWERRDFNFFEGDHWIYSSRGPK